jgi:hypothetical protein
MLTQPTLEQYTGAISWLIFRFSWLKVRPVPSSLAFLSRSERDRWETTPTKCHQGLRSAAFGINALREGHGIQINVPGPQPTEIDDAKLWPAQWRIDLK